MAEIAVKKDIAGLSAKEHQTPEKMIHDVKLRPRED